MGSSSIPNSIKVGGDRHQAPNRRKNGVMARDTIWNMGEGPPLDEGRGSKVADKHLDVHCGFMADSTALGVSTKGSCQEAQEKRINRRD